MPNTDYFFFFSSITQENAAISRETRGPYGLRCHDCEWVRPAAWRLLAAHLRGALCGQYQRRHAAAGLPRDRNRLSGGRSAKRPAEGAAETTESAVRFGGKGWVMFSVKDKVTVVVMLLAAGTLSFGLRDQRFKCQTRAPVVFTHLIIDCCPLDKMDLALLSDLVSVTAISWGKNKRKCRLLASTTWFLKKFSCLAAGMWGACLPVSCAYKVTARTAPFVILWILF